MPSSRFEQGQRIVWPDWAKGIGILLVVVGHVWRGLYHAGLPIGDATFHIVDTLIYNFHMPLFFFVAGLFFTYQFQRTDLGHFLWTRVSVLIWPLIVWTWLFFLMKGIIGHLANHPAPLSDFPFFPLPPREEFWFLWALFLVQVQLALVWRWGYRLPNQLVLLLIAIALYVYRPGTGSYAPWIVGAYSQAPFLLLGSLYSLTATRPRTSALWMWALLFVLAELTAVTFAPNEHLLQLCVSALAVLSLVRWLEGLERKWQSVVANWTAWTGKASLTIYVGHVFFTASFRILLVKFGVINIPIHLTFGTVLGLVGPIMMALILRRIGLARALGLRFP